MIPSFFVTLLLAAHACLPATNPWPYELDQVSTTRHLASVTLGTGDSGDHTVLLANTPQGYRCIGLAPGGIPGPQSFARLSAMAASVGIPTTPSEVQALLSGNGAAGVNRPHVFFRYVVQSQTGLTVVPMTSGEANTRANAIYRAAPGHVPSARVTPQP